jgi:beta-lactamase regulating signal transducer with metallopeptidase domain
MDMILGTIVLTLGWFAAVNAGGSLLTWALCDRLVPGHVARGARTLLTVRLFPAAVSILFAAGMFLPAHILFEPRDVRETLGAMWYVLAAAGAFLVIRSVARARRVWRVGRQLRRGERPAVSLAAGVVEVDGHPGVSLAGVLRPRILIGPEVVRELTSAELDVAIAHELAHRDALDNLARWSIACAPDWFGSSARARGIEQAWHEAAESLADRRAVHGDRDRAVHLASALIKVARLSVFARPATSLPAWSTLNDPPLLERRVRSLLSGPVPAPAPHTSGVAIGLTFALGLGASVPAVAGSIHRVTEQLINVLP